MAVPDNQPRMSSVYRFTVTEVTLTIDSKHGVTQPRGWATKTQCSMCHKHMDKACIAISLHNKDPQWPLRYLQDSWIPGIELMSLLQKSPCILQTALLLLKQPPGEVSEA